MKKKNFALLSLLLCAMFVLSSCAGTPTSPASSAAATTAQAAASSQAPAQPAASAEAPSEPADPFGKYDPPIVLRGAFATTGTIVYLPGNPDYDSADQNVYMQAYLDRLDIDVEFDWISADMDAYNTKWNLAMAQQNLPDFGYVNAAQYKMLVDAGLCADMTDIFEEYASPMYKDFLEADNGVVRGYSTFDGRMMGLPITGAQPDAIALMFIRQDWLDQLNLEVPKTIDELEATAQAFIDEGLAPYGIISCKNNASSPDVTLRGIFNGYGAQLGSWLKGGDGKLYYSSTGDEMKAPLLKMQDMYAKGLFNQDFAVADINATREELAAAKAGIIFGTFHNPTGLSENIMANEEAVWTVAEVPTHDGKPQNAFGSVSRSSFYFVNAKYANPEAVVKLVNLELSLIFSEDPEEALKYTTHAHPGGNGTIQTSKYCATVSFAGMPWQNLTRHTEATSALDTGVENFSIALSKTTLDNFNKYLGGDRTQYGAWLIFGPDGTFSKIRQYKDDNRITLDEYQTLPTDTMTEKKAILDDALWAAAVKVIMGEDIATYEKAVSDWYTNGGQTMTDEVNAWYQGG